MFPMGGGIVKIAIVELRRGVDLKDFPEYMEVVSGGVATATMQELHNLMTRPTIDRKRGPIEGKISKLLAYGDPQMPGAQIKIGEIGQSIKDFVRRQKEGMQFTQNNCIRQSNGIKEIANDFRLRVKSLCPLKETDDFDGSDFYGFCGDFEENKGRWQLEIGEDTQYKGKELEIYNEDTGNGGNRKRSTKC